MINEPKLELENSQTLFRFTTIRAPQKLTEGGREDYFIQHPNVTGSPLFSNTIDEFQNRLREYTPISAIEIKTVDFELYKTAENILQSRSFISSEELKELISPLNINPQQNEDIWNSFCYHVFKGDSSEDREILSTLIYGQHIISNANNFIQSITDTETAEVNEDEFRKFLSSSIVIPKEFISPENHPIIINDSAISNAQPFNGNAMNYNSKIQKDNVLTADFKIAQCDLLENAIKNVEKKYLEQEAIQKNQFQINLEAEIETAYQQYKAQYPEVNNITPESQPIPSFIPPTLADTFDYNQLRKNTLESALTTESRVILERFGLNSENSISEISEKIAEMKQTAYQQKFENIPTEKNTLVIDGQAIESLSFGLESKSISLCASTNGSITTFDCGYLDFKNSNEFASSVKYRVGGSGAFKTTAVFQNGFSFTADYTGFTAATYNTVHIVEIEVTTNLGSYNVTMNFNEQTCGVADLNFLFGDTDTPENPIYGLVRLGIMDYRKVEQYICCYVPGEVSHIENIMAREYKSRTTRRLRRSENTTTTSTESEREKLTDTASTEKNEMQEELSKLMQETKDFQINAGITWQGPVQGHVDGSFAYHTSKEESNKLAKSISKELTMKATERILDKTREERIQKIVEEYSDENQHGVDNRQGDKHISGVYRWVDKIYKNVIHNYGKRLLYEFMIPEPASFHQLSLDNKPNLVNKLKAPVPLEENGLTTPSDLNDYNFSSYAGIYGVDIETPPIVGINISKSYTGGVDKGGPSKYSFSDIVIPEGYRLLAVNCIYEHKRYTTDNKSQYDTNLDALITVGNQSRKVLGTGNWRLGNSATVNNFSFNYWNDDALTAENVPVAVNTWDVGSFTLTVNAIFKRLAPIYQNWQVASYNKIKKAYDEKYKAYQDKLAEVQAQQVEARQTNSLFYREIEQMVLRKNCMSYLTNNGLGNQNFISGSDLKSHTVTQNKALEDYAAKVKFLEQAFEWEIMGYQFYPFYWADKAKWDSLYSRETSDKFFTKFLQSGMARVFLTVRPGFEASVNWYLATGQVWNGSQPPVIGDPLFLSIVDELKQPESIVEGEWESRVPSTLTVIQADTIALDTKGLPCMDTCKEHKSNGFETDTTTLKDLVVKIV